MKFHMKGHAKVTAQLHNNRMDAFAKVSAEIAPWWQSTCKLLGVFVTKGTWYVDRAILTLRTCKVGSTLSIVFCRR